MRPRDRQRRRPNRRHAFRAASEPLESRIALSADIGVNLDVNNAGVDNPIWTDLHNLAGSWVPASGSTVASSADGYPLANASTYFNADNYPAGNYQFSYSGSATVSFSGAAQLVGSVSVSGGVTTGTVAFSPLVGDGKSIVMQLTNVDPSNPMDNFHLMMPGYGNGTSPAAMFTPQFIQVLQPFSTIRFMNWTQVIRNPVANWSARVGPNAFLTDGNGGVPYEDMIELCNEAQKDMWLNIPVDSTPSFVQNLAQLVASRLDPNLNVYVEYGNEVWNFSFEKSQVYIAARANSVLNQSLGNYQLIAQQTAYTLVNDGQIFDQAFGSASARVRPVLGGQAAWTAFASLGLQFIQQYFGAPSNFIYGTAVAPYVGITTAQDVSGLTLNQLFADMNQWLTTQGIPQIQASAALAKQYDIPLLAYEGGQGLAAGSTQRNALLFNEAQSDPRMFQVYTALIDDWQQAGGQLFNAYQLTEVWSSIYGDWGMLQFVTQTGGPAYDSLVASMYAPGDFNVDGSVNYADLQVLESNYGTGGSHWTQGDLSHDGLVNWTDLNAMRQALNLSGLTLSQFAQQAVFGVPADVPAGTALEYDGFGVTYASNLPPASSTGTVKLNTNSAGQPIVLGGATYSQGLGFAGSSSASFALNGQYTTFDSTIGVDSSGTAASSVIFEVFGDGTLLYQSPVMAYGSSPNPIEVNLSGVQTLTLTVAAAPGSIAAYDRAAWGDARLVSTVNLGSSPYTLTWQLMQNGQAVSTQSADSFSFAAVQGTYTINLTVTNSQGLTATASTTVTAVTRGTSTASSFGEDLVRQGNWIGAYGSQGYDIPGLGSALPSYAKVSVTDAGTFTWATNTTALNALEDPGTSTRIVTGWTSQSAFDINLDLTDGQAHTLTLYAVDWMNRGVQEQIQVIDGSTGNVLDSETIAGFSNGVYLRWVVSGQVVIKLSDQSLPVARIDGLFLDPIGTGTASFVKKDTTTQGTWVGAYGGQGYDIEGFAPSLPSYALVNIIGASTYTWAASTADTRALENPPGGPARSARTWFGGNFTINVNLSDGQVHDLALYAVDWDNQARQEQIQVIDPATGTVLDSEVLSSFGTGAYLQWAVVGDVQIRVTRLAGINAVVSGLFLLDPSGPGTASFVKKDATTQGTWVGTYGARGYDIEGFSQSLPSYASINTTGASTYTWAASAADTRALENPPGGPDRSARTWYGGSFTIDVNLSDGQVHDLALYAVDWDNGGRQEQIQVIDPATGKVLDSEVLSSFGTGAYLQWAVRGHVQIRVTRLAGINAVVSGLFLD
jgi:hypothetical protein